MQVVTMVLVFLLAVVVSGFVARLLPIKVPLPLLQIASGSGLSYVFGFEVAFDPHLFLLLFIPPLLFLDGWRIPKGAFFRDWKWILALAIGLVVFTVIGLGYFIHWILPAMPLAVAFALAAILSPTDPVAVAAMTANSPLPPRLMHILEGESLLNDATGLVCFSFAVGAAMTGAFSFGDAATSFVLVAGGGLLTGLTVTWAIGALNTLLVRRTGEDPPIQILISLLIPFAAYLAAEHLNVSGILAAAVAGMAMHYTELSGRVHAATRMQRSAVWDMIQMALNGIIFVLLGDQLPRFLTNLPAVAASIGSDNAWHLLAYVVLITIALGALRYFWVWLTTWFSVRRVNRSGTPMAIPDRRLLGATAAAGVRGAITLAGVLTLPLMLADGSPFPGREAAIFLAMGVILLSLLLAGVGLPILISGVSDVRRPVIGRSDEDFARTAAAEAAVRRVEALMAAPPKDPARAAVYSEAALRLLDVYKRRLDYGDVTGEDTRSMREVADAERRLRIEALSSERAEYFRLSRTRAIDDDMLRRLVREIDLMETSLMHGPPVH